MQYGNFFGQVHAESALALIWQTPATRRRAHTGLCRSTAKQGIQPSGPMNFGHIHSQGLRNAFTVCARKKAAQPPASATRLSCSPRTIPSRVRAAPCRHGSDCVYAFTAGGHSRDCQRNFSVKMLQAVLRGGRASCFHRYAAAYAGPACSSCRALSSLPQKRHNVRHAPAVAEAKPPILTTGGLQCCCPA